jgi:hypothetical protein
MNAVAGAHLRVMLPVLLLVAEIVHEGSQVNQEGRIRGGRQRRTRAGVRGRCGIAAVTARAKNCYRKKNHA